MLNEKNILLGLITSNKTSWQDKIKELSEFKITEIALFPADLNMTERKELYKALEASPVESIPYLRLSNDMTQEEIDYLVSKYKTKLFSIYANEAGYKVLDKLPKYAAMISVENNPIDKLNRYFVKKQFDEHKVAGVCLDLAHLENARRNNKPLFKKLQSMLNKYTIECNHVSAVSTNIFLKLFHKRAVTHELKTLAELDYLRKFPEHYFSKYIIIELDNSFEEQIEVQKHLVNMLEYVINH